MSADTIELGWLIAHVLAGIWKRFQMQAAHCGKARALGIDVPPQLLAIADEVIE